MDTAQVNSYLKRSIAPGTRYNKYFGKSSCKATYLGESDTFFTVAQMRKWAYKFQSQTKKLALGEFAGLSLKDTSDKIYRFLYEHLQYELDGRRQNLKSPACAWSTRKEGTDCKSYSIFASTILQNLGIKHYFRKVKQPSLNPDLWSHVYVVIPEDQKKGDLSKGYHVIDATVHSNIEVEYSAKNDIYMDKVSLPHYGLAAAGMGCSCQNKTPILPLGYTNYDGILQNTGISSPASVANVSNIQKSEEGRFKIALLNFKAFLKDLERKGVPRAITQEAERRLQTSINTDKEPTLGQLLDPSYTGLGVGIIPGSITAPLIPASGLPVSTPSVGAGPLAVVGTATSILNSVVPKDFLSKTFGSVFANGFKFSCWGTSGSPAKAAKQLEQEIIPAFKARAQAVLSTPIGQLQTAINNFHIWARSVHVKSRWWFDNGSKGCTRDGQKVKIPAMDAAIAALHQSFEQLAKDNGYKLEATTPKQHAYPPDPSVNLPEPYTMQVPQYRLVQTSAGAQNIPEEYWTWQGSFNPNPTASDTLPPLIPGKTTQNTSGFTNSQLLALQAQSQNQGNNNKGISTQDLVLYGGAAALGVTAVVLLSRKK